MTAVAVGLPTTQAATATTLVVNEVFGPTLQGEGPSLGKRAAFLRLGGCNLHCSWCDTKYTWDASQYDLRKENTRRSVGDVVAQLVAMEPAVVVLTGGEPLLQQRQGGWVKLLTALDDLGIDTEVETNGTQVPDAATAALVTRFNVSPKLAHAGDPPERRLVPAALQQFSDLARAGRATLKVVVRTEADVAAAAALGGLYGWPNGSVYVMAEGTTAAQLLPRQRLLAQAALDNGVGMTTRLHSLLWGQERGK